MCARRERMCAERVKADEHFTCSCTILSYRNCEKSVGKDAPEFALGPSTAGSRICNSLLSSRHLGLPLHAERKRLDSRFVLELLIRLFVVRHAARYFRLTSVSPVLAHNLSNRRLFLLAAIASVDRNASHGDVRTVRLHFLTGATLSSSLVITSSTCCRYSSTSQSTETGVDSSGVERRE